MWRALLLLIASAHVASCFALQSALLRPGSVKPACSRVTAVLPPESFIPPPEVFSDAASQAASTGGLSPIADVITTLFVCAIAFKMVGGMEADTEENAAGTEENSRTKFGWLQADMRVPLPTLEALRESCHLIGQHDGYHMYLCGSRQPDGSALSKCAHSEDFSTYYGTQVFVCQGSKSEMARV